MTAFDLANRTAVISGGGAGIGRALAQRAGTAGMAVAICDVDAAGLEETAEWLRQRQVKVVAELVDVRDAEAMVRFASKAEGELPPLGIVWANAGINLYNRTTELDLAAWNRVIDINLKGPINMIAAFLPRLIATGLPGRFAITGSQASFMGAPELGAYCASKHALWAIADTMRIELQQAGPPIEVSLLAPPRVATAIIATTIERTRAAKGDAGVEELLATVMTPDAIAEQAWDGVVAGEPVIVPGFAESAPMVRRRMDALLALAD